MNSGASEPLFTFTNGNINNQSFVNCTGLWALEGWFLSKLWRNPGALLPLSRVSSCEMRFREEGSK